MRRAKTFRQILEETAAASSHRLAARARLASHVAKCARDMNSKRRAYGVKHAALEHGVAVFPSLYALSGLEEDGRLVRVQVSGAGCFHLPLAGCGEGTRGWIDAERARVVVEWDAGRRAA